MQQLTTIEDLRLYLKNNYVENKSELDKFNPVDTMNYFNKFVDNYSLTKEEYDYVMPVNFVQEDQANAKTMINSQKALQILLKRKK